MTQSFQNAARDALRQMVLNARREIPTEPDHAIPSHRADEFLRQALEDAIYNVHHVDDDGGPPLSDVSHRPTLVAPQAVEDSCPRCDHADIRAALEGDEWDEWACAGQCGTTVVDRGDHSMDGWVGDEQGWWCPSCAAAPAQTEGDGRG